jgi:hypothetical protein
MNLSPFFSRRRGAQESEHRIQIEIETQRAHRDIAHGPVQTIYH